MWSFMQDSASTEVRPWNVPSVQQLSGHAAELTRAQQPVVVSIRPKTDSEMMAALMKKLDVQAATQCGARGVAPSSVSRGACTFDVPSPSADVAVMAKKLCTDVPLQVFPGGIRPPPGLSLPAARAPHVPGGPRQKIDAHPFGMKDIYGFSKIVDEEQSSTNDDGDHDTCESLPSEDEVARSPVLSSSTAMPGGMTTLMVRNVPVMYTQEMLLLEWQNVGAYDFLYLPRTGQTNLSYAFINFVSEAHAMAFKAQWHKKRMAHFTSRKPLNISFADVQGLEANILQLKKKRVRRIELRQCQPFITKGGRQFELAEALAVMQH